MKVLVTGHHGYIGSVLTPILDAAGHDVVGLDTFYYGGCDFGASTPWDEYRRQDVRDTPDVDLEGFDAVVHLAALSNDPIGDLNPGLTYAINLEASVELARKARAAGVERFIFASSCSMYGAAPGGDLVTEDAALRPLTPYAESKVKAEEAILDLADGSFAPVSMRNATAYGVSPRLRLDIVLNNLTAWAHTTGAIRLQSDGTSWRPLVHIADISKATLTLLTAPVAEVRREAFNIGTAEQNYQIRTLAEIVQRRMPSCEITFADGVSADPRSYRVDFGKFARTFPESVFEWTAERGADELATAYDEIGLTADELTGERYLRLGRLKRLLADGSITGDLRWVRV